MKETMTDCYKRNYVSCERGRSELRNVCLMLRISGERNNAMKEIMLVVRGVGQSLGMFALC